jgi:hypothetical protein
MDVLIDNSLFAGLMRQYAPDLRAHKSFIREFPDHKKIDKVSTAQFLNALVVFDEVRLLVEDKIALVGREDAKDQERISDWARDLIKLLPQSVQGLIEFNEEGDKAVADEGDAIQKSIELYSRDIPGREELFVDGHIPFVYESASYIYRPRFGRIREINFLDQRELGHAMFLHRGLRLLDFAHRKKMIYQPYWYRANLLAKASPLLLERAPTDGQYTAQLPSRRELSQLQNDYMKQFDRAYYTVISLCKYARPDYAFPFIGAAILDSAKGDTKRALSAALEHREAFKKTAGKWQDLMKAIAQGRKADADEIAATITRQIQRAAGTRLALSVQPYEKGVSTTFAVLGGMAVEGYTGSKAAGKLSETILDAIADIVPESAKQSFRKFVEETVEGISNNPYRLLLTQHLDALASAYE